MDDKPCLAEEVPYPSDGVLHQLTNTKSSEFAKLSFHNEVPGNYKVNKKYT